MRVIWISCVIIALDQLTKFWIQSTFALYESIEVLGDFFRLTFIENPGMAFGLRFAGPWFFTAFSFIASIAIIIMIYRMRNEKLMPRFALALVLGGAVGNLIDRFLNQKVVDFLDFGFSSYRFPIFNIADTAVSIGMAVLLYQILLEKDESQFDNSRLPESAHHFSESEETDIWQLRK